MAVSEQKLNEILKTLIDEYRRKGSIPTDVLFDVLEKIDTSADQFDYVYKAIGEAGIQIVDEDERDRELFEQALKDIGAGRSRQNVSQRYRQSAAPVPRRGDHARPAYAGRR